MKVLLTICLGFIFLLSAKAESSTDISNWKDIRAPVGSVSGSEFIFITSA